ncbi:uncharacterized protein EHS24_005021 [Apiotrichum porosum]|uniref:Uncharacterized protein n=1 Tax=Apiotrichum porosum TaxID=105984 RepID=A0A427Y6N1_9TREE|nr:uncharacterized protein EHS24_005021 [Apiotrichum porosum]RSH86749.1 hypothetical protein EHS24_005021 [Apiotrichum porosum]
MGLIHYLTPFDYSRAPQHPRLRLRYSLWSLAISLAVLAVIVTYRWSRYHGILLVIDSGHKLRRVKYDLLQLGEDGRRYGRTAALIFLSPTSYRRASSITTKTDLDGGAGLSPAPVSNRERLRACGGELRARWDRYGAYTSVQLVLAAVDKVVIAI